MPLPFRIAARYFLAKKSRLVNIISGVSLLSLAVATAAMLVIFSVALPLALNTARGT